MKKTPTLFSQISFVSVLCLVMVLTVVSSCSNNAEEQDESTDTTGLVTSKEALIEHLDGKTENFTIDITKDTLLSCEKGTKIFFEANSLVLPNGGKPKGPVEIEIKEAYSVSDMIANNLTTMSGDKLLQSGGMINITAKSDGKELVMKTGKEYAVLFPKSPEDDVDMKTFYGSEDEDGTIGWTLAEELTKKEVENPGMTDQNATEVASPQDVGRSNQVNRKLREKRDFIVTPFNPFGNEMKLYLKNSNLDVYDYFKKNFNFSEEMKKDFFSGDVNHAILLTFLVDTTGNLKRIRFKNATTINKYNSQIKSFLEKMPEVDVDRVKNFTPTQIHHMMIQSSKLITGSKSDILKFRREAQREKREKYRKKVKSTIEDISEKAVKATKEPVINYYILKSTRLGWVNCDDFMRSQRFLNLQIIADNGLSDNVSLLIIYKRIRAASKGKIFNSKGVFERTAANEDVKIIAIDYSEEKPKVSTADINTNQNIVTLNDFDYFTLEELDEELQGIW